MRIDLQQLSSTSARITLPSAGHEAQFIHIAETQALKGVLEQGDGSTQVSECTAEAIRLLEAQLRFGSVQLRAATGALLKRIAMQLHTSDSDTAAEVDVGHLELSAFTVRTGSVLLSAQVMARQVKLTLDGSLGSITSSYLELREVTLTIGTTAVSAPHLVAQDLVLKWGGPSGFALEVGLARAGDLTLTVAGTEITATSLACTALAYKTSRFTLGTADAEKLAARTRIAPPADAANVADAADAADAPAGPKESHASAQQWFDWALLDGLQGHVNVDLGVNMMLAVLPRHAVHHLRLDVSEGCINYRAAEDGLARLEDALLDFSVREDTLVLELGIPFIHTRGHGKPLVRWALTPDDVRLAEMERVRLSVLARPITAPHDEASEEVEQKRAPSAFRVRGVDAEEVDVQLALSPARSALHGVVRELGFESATLSGDGHVRLEGGDAEGHMELDVRALSVALASLPLGASTLDLGNLTVPGRIDVQVGLAGARADEVSLISEHTSVRNFSFG